jgi:RNA polymerase primary sigma factor
LSEKIAIRSEFKRAICILPEREAQILELRFGFSEEGHEMTLAEIGRRYCVTRERIRQIEAKALCKPRDSYTNAFLRENFQD